MSIVPFSENEIRKLETLLNKQGWKREGEIENNFRYGINRKDKVIILTMKFPVRLPVRLNIPLDVASFKLSIAFKFFHLDRVIETILYFLVSLKDFAANVDLEHDFPLKGKEQSLVELLNVLMPDLIQHENERSWVNRIRISLFNKREKFDKFEANEIKNIVSILKENGLDPTFDLPWELKKGIPKMRTAETLFFSTGEQFDEFFILEKGFFTYFKDIIFKKLYLRSCFESYMPYILHDLFESETNFSLEELTGNWIRFARLLLNSLLEIIQNAPLILNEYINIKPKRDLTFSSVNGEENNFAFSALHYESKIAKELYSIHNDLFNKPPEGFEVIETLNFYSEAEELIKHYKFEEATKILNESLKIFNKHRQRKAVVSVLLLLRKIAALLNKTQVEINYLQSALSVAKSGDIPINFIIQIHYYLGKAHYSLQNYQKSIQHFNILVNFTENEEIKIKKRDELLGLSYLYLGLMRQKLEKHADAKEDFKNAFSLGSQSQKVKFKYHLLRSQYYKNKGNLSQAQKFLKISLDNKIEDIDENARHIFMKLLLELTEFYIHHRKDSKKAIYLLKLLEDHMSVKSIPMIKITMKWSLLMSDYFNFLERNSNNSKYYLKQHRTLRAQLLKIGVVD